MFVLIGIDFDKYDGVINYIKTIKKSDDKNELMHYIEDINNQVQNERTKKHKYDEEFCKKIKEEYDLAYNNSNDKYTFFWNYIKENLPPLYHRNFNIINSEDLFKFKHNLYIHKDYEWEDKVIENCGLDFHIIEV